MNIDIQSLAAAASIAGVLGAGVTAAGGRLLRWWKERAARWSVTATEKLAAETDNVILGGAEAAVSALKDALGAEQQDNKRLRAEVTELRVSVRKLEGTLAQQERENNQLQTQLDHMQARIIAMDEDFKQFRNDQ